MKRFMLAAAAIACAFAAHAQQKVTIRDNSADGTIIPKEIYGQFSEHLGSCIYGGLWVGPESDIPNKDGYRLDVLEALKKLQVPVLRWPGGCFADDYHWRDGIGPREQRTKISNNNWGGTLEDNSFGTHEFLNLCEILGCEPYISGNVGSGTPEEMAKWVEYMTSDSNSTVVEERRRNGRDKAWDVKFFGVGNEAWGCGGNMTPEYYSSVYRRYATYLRDYNPHHGLYKIASGASDTDYNWTKVCTEAIGNRMQAIAVHYYTCLSWSGSKGSATNFAADEYYRSVKKAIEIEPCLKRHIAIMDSIDPANTIDLLVDEWGTWFDVEPGTNPGHLFQQNTMRDAMVAAMSLNIFHKYTKRVKMTNIAQIVNVLQSMILTRGNQMVLTPTYHVYEMYKVHQDAQFIPVDVAAGSLSTVAGDIPAISATASRKDGVVNVSLANPSLDRQQTILLTWESLNSGRKAGMKNARVLTAKNVTDYNDFGKQTKVEPKEFKGYRITKEGVEITLPAFSVVTFAL